MDYGFMEHYLAKPDESLASHNANLKKNMALLQEFGYLDPKYEKVLEVAIDSHDIGKINSHFQHRVQHGGRFDKENEIGHNILSAFFVDLENRLSSDEYYKAVDIVLNHHHYVKNYQALHVASNQTLIQQGVQEILQEMKKHEILHEPRELSTRFIEELEESSIQFDTRLLQGFLHKCDYAASAGIPIEYKNDFLLEKMDDLDYTWNELQVFCQKHQEENLLISAPTGDNAIMMTVQ